MLSLVNLCRRALSSSFDRARSVFVIGAIAFAAAGCAKIDPWDGNISFSNIQTVSSGNTLIDASCPLTGTAHSANFGAQISASGSVSPTGFSQHFMARIGVYGAH